MRKRALRRQTEEAQVAALVDACNLVAEIAGEIRPASVDPGSAGLILAHAETVRRMIGMWMRVAMTDGTWSLPVHTQVFLTDQRLILRPRGSGLQNMYWGNLTGFEADLTTGHVSFDFGCGEITLLSGTSAAVLAVQGVHVLYGPQGLLTHPALDEVRGSNYLRTF